MKWLGINDLENEGVFITGNGEKTNFFNWNSGEPDNFQVEDNFDQDAVRMHSNGNWSDGFVFFEHAFICIIDPYSFMIHSE